jgi:hypothetical protein
MNARIENGIWTASLVALLAAAFIMLAAWN